MSIKKVAVWYGGVSPEHEVAIISAVQVMKALKTAGVSVVPVYVAKDGRWVVGDDNFLDVKIYKNLERVLKMGKEVVFPANRNYVMLTKQWWGFGGNNDEVDVVFPVFHGRNGEDGTIQGLLEMANVPYVGCGVTASSVGMDKLIAKTVAKDLGFAVANGQLLLKGEKLDEKLKYPMFVKPANLGSSIGVTRVENKKELKEALEVGFCYDSRVLIEEAIDLEKEVNISVMGGNGRYEVSVTEQPMTKSELLSFEDKYLGQSKTKGMASAKRVIPAMISDQQKKKIENMAKSYFRMIGGNGLARIDFMVDKKGEIYFNEINTIPGSLAFYLWDKSGYPFPKLVTKLLELAVEDWQEKQKRVTTFESNILAGFGGGVKGKA